MLANNEPTIVRFVRKTKSSKEALPYEFGYYTRQNFTQPWETKILGRATSEEEAARNNLSTLPAQSPDQSITARRVRKHK